MAKKESKTARWSRLASAAVDALTELEEMRAEYEEQRDNLPENLRSSARGEKLDAIADLDIGSALETAQEAADAELPLGFGRD